MSKIKVNEALLTKAVTVFENAGSQVIMTGEGLTRQELRVLERANLVIKRTTHKARKYTDSTSQMIYAWEWIGDKND